MNTKADTYELFVFQKAHTSNQCFLNIEVINVLTAIEPMTNDGSYMEKS